jgi:hypothetical protein
VRVAIEPLLPLPRARGLIIFAPLQYIIHFFFFTEFEDSRLHQSSTTDEAAIRNMAPTLTQVVSTIRLAKRDTSTSTALPQAPPALGVWRASTNDGWSPSAIIGIVAAVVIILVLVPLIAIILRRYERKRCLEMLPDASSGRLGSSKSSMRENQSLKSILVTKEVLRSSLRMTPALTKPDEAHTHGRVWSQTEVRGGDLR